MSRSTSSWFPRTVAGMAALGVNASCLAHVLAVGVVLLAPWERLWSSRAPDRAELSGRMGVILIQATFAEPEPMPVQTVEIPATEAPVVVMPNEVRIEERTMVATASSEVEATIEAEEPSRPSSPSVHFAARPKVESRHQPQVAEHAPRLPKAAAAPPMMMGFEEGATFAGNAPPLYPDQARTNGWTGTVLLRLWVDATGQVTKVNVERSSGYAVLDASAVNAVSHWKGNPARRDGKPLATEEILPVEFRFPVR